VRRWCLSFGIRIRFDRPDWSLLARFSLPAVVRSIVSTPAVWITRSMLAQQPDGMAQLGLFHAAWQWYMLVMMIPEFWTRALVPVLSERIGAGAHRQFRRVIASTSLFNLLVVLCFSTAVYLLSDWILLLYGRELRFSEGLLLLALATGTLSAAAAPIGSALTATGAMWAAAGVNAVWGIALIVCTYFLGSSAQGLAVAYFLGYVIHGLTAGLLLWYVLVQSTRRPAEQLGAVDYTQAAR
jgi:Na+-driven multidrug efflux pump